MFNIMVTLEKHTPVWVLWRGKVEYSPNPKLRVNVKYRNGTYDYNFEAGEFNWFHSDGVTESHHEPEYDIIAYQFV